MFFYLPQLVFGYDYFVDSLNFNIFLQALNVQDVLKI